MTIETQQFEERISTALSRLAAAVAALASAAQTSAQAAVPAPDPRADDPDLRAALNAAHEALVQERATNATLEDRVEALRERQAHELDAQDRRVAQLQAQVDAQGVEMQRLRMGNVQLRETLRALRDAAEAGVADAHLINKAMQAELDALRNTRLAEIAEMDEILAELDPLIGSAPAQETKDA